MILQLYITTTEILHNLNIWKRIWFTIAILSLFFGITSRLLNNLLETIVFIIGTVVNLGLYLYTKFLIFLEK